MADLNKKYQKILDELTKKIQDPNELEFVKGKINELVIEYMNSIERIFEIQKTQAKLENKVNKIQQELSMIEEDIYVNDDLDDSDYIGDKMHDNDLEFEITCPYCGYEFLTDESYKSETEIKCPQCHEIIELDWKDEKCGGDCHSCSGQCYSNDDTEEDTSVETVTVEEAPTDSENTTITNNNEEEVNYKNNNVNQILQNKEKNKNNNEDDM